MRAWGPVCKRIIDKKEANFPLFLGEKNITFALPTLGMSLLKTLKNTFI